MFRPSGKMLLLTTLVLSLAALPITRAAAQLTNYPPPVILDADMCSEQEIVIWYQPNYLQTAIGLTYNVFAYFGETVSVDPMYDTQFICDPASDPHGLTRFYRIRSVGGPFQNNTAEYYHDIMEMLFVDWYPYAEMVEMDCQLTAQAVPAGISDGWNLHNLDLDTSLVAGWDPIIAVLDTGIDELHPLFLNNSTQILEGWNHYDDNAHMTDVHGHGTAMAGIIATLAPDAQILPYKVLGDDGIGYWGAVARALLNAGKRGAGVANLSLGGPRESPWFFRQVVDEVTGCYDMVVVAAAGNSCETGYNCPEVFYPAMHQDIIAVASYDNMGRFFRRGAGFGNDIDIAAPGLNVCVAWSQGASDASSDPYRRLSGSSIATAQVSAVAGLVRHLEWGINNEEVLMHLQATALYPTESIPNCGGDPAWLNACLALDLGGCVGDTDYLVDFDTTQTCELYSGPPAVWDYDTYSTVQSQNCPANSNFIVYESNLIPAPALGYCPEYALPSLRCMARLNSQPSRPPCPDCDADIYLSFNWMLVQLRLRSYEMDDITDLVVRVGDGTGLWSYPLDTSQVPSVGTTATLNYWVYLGGGPDLSNPNALSASLVTYFNINNKNNFTIDQLNVDAI